MPSEGKLARSIVSLENELRTEARGDSEMLVVDRFDESGPSALKGYLVIYSLGVAQGCN
jgi:hypothetical protein